MTKEEFNKFIDETIAAPVEELSASQVGRRFSALTMEYPTKKDKKNLEGLTEGEREVYEHMRVLPLLRSFQRLFPDWNARWFQAEDIDAAQDEDRRAEMQHQAEVLADVDVEFFDTEYFILLESYAKSFLRLVGMYEACMESYANGCKGCVWHYRGADGSTDCKPRMIFGAAPTSWTLDKFKHYLRR